MYIHTYSALLIAIDNMNTVCACVQRRASLSTSKGQHVIEEISNLSEFTVSVICPAVVRLLSVTCPLSVIYPVSVICPAVVYVLAVT